MIRTTNADASEQAARNTLYLHKLTAARARSELAQANDWAIHINDDWTISGERKHRFKALYGSIALHCVGRKWFPNPEGSPALIASLNKLIPFINWPPDNGDYDEALATHRDITGPLMLPHASDIYYREKGSSYVQIGDELFHFGAKDIANLDAAPFMSSGILVFWRCRVKYYRTVNGVAKYGYYAHLEANGRSEPHVISPASLFSDSTINRLKTLQYRNGISK